MTSRQLRQTKCNNMNEGNKNCLHYSEWKSYDLTEGDLLGSKNITVITFGIYTVNATVLVQHSLAEIVTRLLNANRTSRSDEYLWTTQGLPCIWKPANDGSKNGNQYRQYRSFFSTSQILEGCVKFRYWQPLILTLKQYIKQCQLQERQCTCNITLRQTCITTTEIKKQ